MYKLMKIKQSGPENLIRCKNGTIWKNSAKTVQINVNCHALRWVENTFNCCSYGWTMYTDVNRAVWAWKLDPVQWRCNPGKRCNNGANYCELHVVRKAQKHDLEYENTIAMYSRHSWSKGWNQGSVVQIRCNQDIRCKYGAPMLPVTGNKQLKHQITFINTPGPSWTLLNLSGRPGGKPGKSSGRASFQKFRRHAGFKITAWPSSREMFAHTKQSWFL